MAGSSWPVAHGKSQELRTKSRLSDAEQLALDEFAEKMAEKQSTFDGPGRRVGNEAKQEVHAVRTDVLAAAQ